MLNPGTAWREQAKVTCEEIYTELPDGEVEPDIAILDNLADDVSQDDLDDFFVGE